MGLSHERHFQNYHRVLNRAELKRTRLLSFVGGLIVDELNLETWTPLRRAS